MSSSISRQNKKLLKQLAPGAHREKVYPYDTLGGIIVCGNTVWGDTVSIVPVDGLLAGYGWEVGGDPLPYHIVGFDIVSKSNPTVQYVLNFIRLVKTSAQVLNVDSGLGEAPADRIYVPLTGGFEVDDWVWVVADDELGGELSQIDSIDPDNYLDMDGDLAALYATAENAVVYLVRRLTYEGQYRSIWTSFSAASTKEMQHVTLHAGREMEAGDDLIARGISSEAGTPEVYVTVVYDDQAE